MAEEEGAPGGIQFPAGDHVGPDRQLGPEVRVAVQQLADRLGSRRHPGVGPEDLHLRVQREQLLHRRLVGVGVEDQVLLHRQLGDPPDHRRVGLAAEEVELPDALVDPPLEPLLHVREDGRVAVPGFHIAARPVGPQLGDDARGRLLVEPERAVVGRAGHQRAAHPRAVENLEDLLGRVYRPVGLAVVDVGVEDRQIRLRLGGSGAHQEEDERQREPASKHRGSPG